MDGDLGSLMQSVLSDPEQMAKITQLAQGLMGQSGGESAKNGDAAAPEGETPGAEPSNPTPSGIPSEGRILSALTKALAAGKTGSRSTALLTAMRPYLRPEKQGKLDRALEVARMVHIAGLVMGELGGGRHGV